MTTSASRPAEGGPLALDYIFHPRSVAIAGVSPPNPAGGFAGVGLGFLQAMADSGFRPLYPVNPKYQEVEGYRCYASLLDIEGPVDYVISSVPASIVPSLVEDCIAKGVKTIHFFTAGFRETGAADMTELEAQVVARATGAGIRVIGPNCMGLYVPESKLSFHSGFPTEAGPVGYLSQSGGNAIDMVITSSVRGVRYSKAISFGNASGAITNFDLLLLSAKGSLYATRPTLGTYVAKRADLLANAAELFDVVGKGIVKINVNSELRVAFRDSLRRVLEEEPTRDEVAIYKIMPAAVEAVQKVVEEKIKLFGSAGKL